MNEFPWLLILIVVYFIAFSIIGYRKGFAATMIATTSTLVALILLLIFAPKVQTLIAEKTTWQSSIADKLSEKLLPEVQTEEELTQKIEELPLPDFLKEKIFDDITDANQGVENKVRALSAKMADTVISAAVYVAGFIVLLILLRILCKLMKLVTRLPVLRQLDGLMGIVLSLVEAFLILNVIFLALSLFSDTVIGEIFMKQIDGSRFLGWLYDHNFLAHFLK